VKSRFLPLATFVILTLLASTAALGATVVDDTSEFTPLNNKDILAMVERRLDAEIIVAAIKASPCTFDTFPPVLREMKRRGVPDIVLEAMAEAPYGPSTKTSSRDDLGPQPIFHYAEQLRQMGFLTPFSSRRGLTTQTRARASRSRRLQ
jgi:hypothetical protein